MHRATGVLLIVVPLLLLAALHASVINAQPPAHSGNIAGFFHELVGEWIGSYTQYNGKTKAPTKYFHAVVKELSPDAYASVFEYYRIDPKTHKPAEAGVSRMKTSISPDGKAINTITGNGDVLIDNETTSPEKHQFTEILHLASAGELQGEGTGRIDVRGMPNGKVTNYASTWTESVGSFRIAQQLKVEFRVLFFAKIFNISTDCTGSRGSDVMSLINATGKNADHAGATPGHP